MESTFGLAITEWYSVMGTLAGRGTAAVAGSLSLLETLVYVGSEVDSSESRSI